jgi:hypothetical protein
MQMPIIPNKVISSGTNNLMRVCEPAGALCIAALLALLPASAIAGTFDIKGPEVEKDEKELLTNHTFQSGFPANADRIRHSFEFVASYAFTDRFKAGAKMNFDSPLGDGTQLSTAGVEGQLFIGKLSPAIFLAWYTGLDLRAHQDETNTLTFGPLIKFGDDALSLTLNPLFTHSFGPNHEDGLAFVYAVGLKGALRESLAIGIEAYGTLPDIGDSPSPNFQDHRIGPVVYIDHDLRPARGDERATKLSLEIGAFVGLTDAAPDWTGKVKATLTW